MKGKMGKKGKELYLERGTGGNTEEEVGRRDKEHWDVWRSHMEMLFYVHLKTHIQ